MHGNQTMSSFRSKDEHSPLSIRVAGATASIALLFLAGKIGGLVRQIVIASSYGAGAEFDAFVVAFTIPEIASRCGIDVAPIDVTDDEEAHWLEACVWPDQIDRFERLRSAIALARLKPPELLAGDAVPSLAPAIERMARSGHPVVTNSWVLNYLTPDNRAAYVAELDRIGAAADISWVYIESPSVTPELPAPDDL